MSATEFIGRYRKAGNTEAVCIPAALRKLLHWPIGTYVLMVQHEGLLMMRPVSKSMLIDKNRPVGAPSATGAKAI